jgi:hypothetical protein
MTFTVTRLSAHYWLLLTLLLSLGQQAMSQTPAWQWGLQTTNPLSTDGSPAAGNAVATDAAGNVYVGGSVGSLLLSTLTATRNFGSAGTLGPGRGGFVAQATATGQWAWVTGVIPSRTGSSLPYNAQVTSIAVMAAGDVYAAGTVQGTSVQVGNQTAALTSTSTSVFVARLTSAGVCQWLRVVDGQFISPALATDPSTGGVVLAGGYLGTPFFGNTLLPAAGPANALFVARLSATGQWLGTAVSTGSAGLLPEASVSTSITLAVGAAGQVGVVCNRQAGDFTLGTTTLPAPAGIDVAVVVAQLSPTNQWQWALGSTGSQESLGFGAAYTTSGALWLSGRGINGTVVGPTTLNGPAGTTPPSVTGFLAQVSATGQWTLVQPLPPSSSGLTAFAGLTVDGAGNAVTLGGLRGFSSPAQVTLGGQTLTSPSTGLLIFVASLSPNGQWRYVATVPPPALADGLNPTAAVLDGSGSLYVTGSLRGSLTLGSTTLTGSAPTNASGLFFGDAVVSKLVNATVLATHSPTPAEAMDFFPNPARGQATLRLPVAANTARTVTITDALGHLVQTYRAPAHTTLVTLELAGLSSGLYFVHCAEAVGKLVVD